ncbi:MAG: Histidine protein kinase DivJ [Syntrophomonadaceae bacterium]|nr:Histidine protein kinase DivJ [Bacillota bacterium]
MQELSLHVLDLLQNSAEAGANRVSLQISEDTRQNLLSIVVEDNGKGIQPEMLEKVSDPFSTTRTTRKVGLGLALLKATAESCGGKLAISSRVGVGTRVVASFRLDHIDRPPLGDIAGTVMVFITGRSEMIFSYHHCRDSRQYEFSSKGYEDLLAHPELLLKMKETIEVGLKNLKTEVG